MAMRKIEPIAIPGVEPGPIEAISPQFELCGPAELYVDESYQRNLSEKSINLIRRIVAEWSWRAFKPPICVRVDGLLHVIDGQHTAIAAATHPSISAIPVMVVPPGDRADRAVAFVRHNRDRIAVSPGQMHFALVAAGDETALTLQQICERAGARILKHPPPYARFKVGDVMCIGSLRTILARRFALGARRILSICVQGELAPVSAPALKAVEELLFGEHYAGQVDEDDLALTIRELGPEAEREAKRFCAEHDMPLHKGLVVTWFRACKGGRRGRRATA